MLRYLRELGYKAVSADDYVSELWETPFILSEISRALEIAQPVTREKVRKKILGDPSARKSLNEIFHREVLERLLQTNANFFEVPLLIETCSQGVFDETWVVSCGLECQLERLEERGLSKEDAQKLINTQLPEGVKVAFAHRIIRTNVELSDVYRQVDEGIHHLGHHERINPVIG